MPGQERGLPEAPPHNHFPLSSLLNSCRFSEKKPSLVPLPKHIMLTLNRASDGSLSLCLLIHFTGEEAQGCAGSK